MNTMDRAAYLARIDQVNREGTYQPNWTPWHSTPSLRGMPI